MAKLESIRGELQIIEGGAGINMADVWKERC
jgi:hypothetical protein